MNMSINRLIFSQNWENTKARWTMALSFFGLFYKLDEAASISRFFPGQRKISDAFHILNWDASFLSVILNLLSNPLMNCCRCYPRDGCSLHKTNLRNPPSQHLNPSSQLSLKPGPPVSPRWTILFRIRLNLRRLFRIWSDAFWPECHEPQSGNILPAGLSFPQFFCSLDNICVRLFVYPSLLPPIILFYLWAVEGESRYQIKGTQEKREERGWGNRMGWDRSQIPVETSFLMH